MIIDKKEVDKQEQEQGASAEDEDYPNILFCNSKCAKLLGCDFNTENLTEENQLSMKLSLEKVRFISAHQGENIMSSEAQ